LEYYELMAFGRIKEAISSLRGGGDRFEALEAELYRRQNHIDQVSAFSTTAHHPADKRIIAADNARIQEIRSELGRYRG
jgi:hypothetical protein